MGVVGGPEITQDQIVFYIDPTNPKSFVSGTTVVNDMIGSVGGTLTNATFSSDNEGIWNFDGTSDYIAYSSEFDFGISSSIEFWFKRGSTSGVQAIIGTDSYPSDYLFDWTNDTDMYVRFGDGWKLWQNDVWNNTSDWFHCVIARDGTNSAKVYLNGSDLGSPTNTSGTWDANTKFNRIGAKGNNTSGFVGKLGPVICYTKTLSPAEVLDNYNLSKWRFV